MSTITPPPTTPFGEDPKAVAAAAKAYAKAQRPWFKKKRFMIPLAVVALMVAVSAAGGGTDKKTTGGTDAVASDAPAPAGVETVSGNTDNPPPADLDPSFDCTTDGLGFATAKGRLTNHSSETSSYIIEMTYTADGVQYATGSAFVNNVGSGVVSEWEANSLTEARPGTTCAVTDVERFAS